MSDSVLYTIGRYVDNYESVEGRLLSNGLYVLNIVFIGLYVLSTYGVFALYSEWVVRVEVGIALVFVVELLARLRFAEDTRGELFNFYTLVDVLAISPVLLYPLSLGFSADFLRVFYALRAVRFLRIALENKRFFGVKINDARITKVKILLTIGLIFFITAGMFYELETGINPEIDNFGDSLYFSIVAISTAGFGDITPYTDAGRFVTMLGLLVAITLIPIQVAQARAVSGKSERVCSRCGLADHDADARYCKQCGEKFVSDESGGRKG